MSDSPEPAPTSPPQPPAEGSPLYGLFTGMIVRVAREEAEAAARRATEGLPTRAEVEQLLNGVVDLLSKQAGVRTEAEAPVSAAGPDLHEAFLRMLTGGEFTSLVGAIAKTEIQRAAPARAPEDVSGTVALKVREALDDLLRSETFQEKLRSAAAQAVLDRLPTGEALVNAVANHVGPRLEDALFEAIQPAPPPPAAAILPADLAESLARKRRGRRRR